MMEKSGYVRIPLEYYDYLKSLEDAFDSDHSFVFYNSRCGTSVYAKVKAISEEEVNKKYFDEIERVESSRVDAWKEIERLKKQIETERKLHEQIKESLDHIRTKWWYKFFTR